MKCDKETKAQGDIDLGIVNIVVGFAPFKPAEFVIIMFRQIARQTEVREYGNGSINGKWARD